MARNEGTAWRGCPVTTEEWEAMTLLMGQALISAQLAAPMGQPYSLTVLNENAKFQQFALFQTIPDIIGPSIDPVSLAWMIGGAASGSPDNPSTSQFKWTIDYAVTAGYIQNLGTTLNPRSFQTASKVDVLINDHNAVNVTYQGPFPNGAPGFPTNPTSGTPGLILAQADNTIPSTVQQASLQMSVNVGIAMAGRAAVAVQLEPNLLYQFTPKPKYYIIAGSFIQGQVIDTAISSSAFEVAFAGVTDIQVRFTQQNQFVEA
jgi:hypothetical protein